jgi:Rrf2 family transcriptional regulator, iron-sulfur cluster assembly transcription factor
MELSTRGRYAVMAMVQLAARAAEGSEPVTLAEIASCQCLSQCYLEQLFARLRRAGLVVATRGPGGGYRLGRPAEDVPIAAIMRAVDENLRTTRCAPGDSGCLGPGGGRCRTHDLWDELGRHIDLFLCGVTLEDVVRDRVQGRAAPAREPVTA